MYLLNISEVLLPIYTTYIYFLTDKKASFKIQLYFDLSMDLHNLSKYIYTNFTTIFCHFFFLAFPYEVNCFLDDGEEKMEAILT